METQLGGIIEMSLVKSVAKESLQDHSVPNILCVWIPFSDYTTDTNNLEIERFTRL